MARGMLLRSYWRIVMASALLNYARFAGRRLIFGMAACM